MILSTGPFKREIGSRPLLDAFFDTVGCRLEPSGCATRFPAIMADLHEGVLTPERATKALSELDEIERELRALPASQILGIKKGSVPDASAIDCLTSPDGRSLLGHLRDGITASQRSGSTLKISDTAERRIALQLSLCVVLLGLAWVVIGRRYFGNWILISLHQEPSDRSGLYLWTAGFLFIAMGAAYALAAIFPRLRVWFQRRTWATLTAALLFVGALIFFGMSPR